MCIIIAHNTGMQPVADDVLDICAHNHPHGFGIAWLQDGEVKMEHTLDEGEIRKKYKEVCKIKRGAVIRHYRRMTHGVVNLDNCHPFKVRDGLVFAHNKTIHECAPKAGALNDKSDTRIFNEQVLQKLPAGAERDPVMVRLLEKFIDNSRIALLDKDGLFFWNKYKGETVGSVWYSNDSYKYREYKASNGYPNGNPNFRNAWDRDKKKEIKELIAKMTNQPPTLKGTEYISDNLLVVWNTKEQTTFAWDDGMKEWRAYSNIKGQFVNAPFSCTGHRPGMYKDYYKTWLKGNRKHAQKNRCACCNDLVERDNLVLGCLYYEDEWVCVPCADFFNNTENYAQH